MAAVLIPNTRCDEAGFYRCSRLHGGRRNARFFVPGQLVPVCPACESVPIRSMGWRNLWYMVHSLNYLQRIVDSPWLDPTIRWPNAKQAAAGQATGAAGVLICPRCNQLHGTEGSQLLYQCSCGGTVWLFIWPESQFDPAMDILV